ncbi:hypothetical protein OE88DRAFT_1734118 [Heliocybe sulcata]|uniref:Uncharacterized protein n=1 Tax=Heliocybe sulcata TaxID=5364 RepID=A0A5C3NHX0_9AGAM|nr:hypothetical protein OE88DRAFT_1734118 [Heliocybe sulcata]
MNASQSTERSIDLQVLIPPELCTRDVSIPWDATLLDLLATLKQFVTQDHKANINLHAVSPLPICVGERQNLNPLFKPKQEAKHLLTADAVTEVYLKILVRNPDREKWLNEHTAIHQLKRLKFREAYPQVIDPHRTECIDFIVTASDPPVLGKHGRDSQENSPITCMKAAIAGAYRNLDPSDGAIITNYYSQQADAARALFDARYVSGQHAAMRLAPPVEIYCSAFANLKARLYGTVDQAADPVIYLDMPELMPGWNPSQKDRT